jgi:hypothetical protein
MTPADFRLLVTAVVFLCINIIILVVYAEVVHVNPSSENLVDVIFFARGRDREFLQYDLWNKYFKPEYKVNYLIVHPKNNPPTENQTKMDATTTQDQNSIKRFYSSNYDQEQDVFMSLDQFIPLSDRSDKFIWASDRVVPIQTVIPLFFERNKNGSRFFAGFNPDAILFNVNHLFEQTIPVTLLEYTKLPQSETYNSFLAHMLSGRHHMFSNVAQELLLPNPKNKPKTIASREMFQIAHLDRTNPNQAMLNQKLKEIWMSYL